MQPINRGLCVWHRHVLLSRRSDGHAWLPLLFTEIVDNDTVETVQWDWATLARLHFHLLALFCFISCSYYPHVPIGKVWIYRIMFVFFCVCFFVCMLRIFLPSIKLVTSNFARQFIGVWGRECHNLGNFAPQGAQNWTNLPACYAATTFTACTTITLWLSNTWQRAVCGHRIGMCGYTVVSEDWHTCL